MVSPASKILRGGGSATKYNSGVRELYRSTGNSKYQLIFADKTLPLSFYKHQLTFNSFVQLCSDKVG